MNRFDIVVGAIAGKVSHSLSSCNPPRARKRVASLLITLSDGQDIRQFFYVACNSDFEILTALQTIETVVRTQIHRFDADKFPSFSIGWTFYGFCRDLGSCLSE